MMATAKEFNIQDLTPGTFARASAHASIQTGAAACEAEAAPSQTVNRAARIPSDFKDCHTISIAYDFMRRRGLLTKKRPAGGTGARKKSRRRDFQS